MIPQRAVCHFVECSDQSSARRAGVGASARGLLHRLLHSSRTVWKAAYVHENIAGVRNGRPACANSRQGQAGGAKLVSLGGIRRTDFRRHSD